MEYSTTLWHMQIGHRVVQFLMWYINIYIFAWKACASTSCMRFAFGNVLGQMLNFMQNTEIMKYLNVHNGNQTSETGYFPSLSVICKQHM